VELVAPPVDDITVEPHEEPHLVRRAAPVLGGERVRRQVRDAQLDRAHDHIEQRRLTALVTLRPGQAALLGPAAVPVHHQRHVPGHELGWNARRLNPLRVRLGRPDRARPVPVPRGPVVIQGTCST
jgi:hypothetical protein